jgi:hypothetical protein
MPLLLYILKDFFYIPPVLAGWRRAASQTDVLDINEGSGGLGGRCKWLAQSTKR